MAAVVSVQKTFALGNTGAMVVGTIAMDNSYATGGEAITIPNAEYVHDLQISNSGGYSFEWDGSTSAPKVKAMRGDNANASPGPQVEVSSAVDLSALTQVRFRAVVGG